MKRLATLLLLLVLLCAVASADCACDPTRQSCPGSYAGWIMIGEMFVVVLMGLAFGVIGV